jgi:aryl-alcohol dehydrogenase-like predicted oxidoreductase
LGTANFGANYAGKNGLNLRESTALIEHFLDCGYTRIDTAAGYGEALSFLMSMKRSTQLTDITTKISFNETDDQLFNNEIDQMKELFMNYEGKVSVLSHNPCLTPIGCERYEKFVSEFSGCYKSVGMSIYSLKDLDLNSSKVQKVQFPVSFVEGGKIKDIKYLKKNGYDISVRSILLRGILFNNLYKKYLNASDAQIIMKTMSGLSSNSEIYRTAVSAMCHNDAISEVIIGAETREQIPVNLERSTCSEIWLTDNDLRVDMRLI